MKTKFIKYIMLTFLMSFGMFFSCNDFLEMETVGKISQEDYYKDDNAVKTSTLAAYDILQALYATDWHSLWMVKTLMADEINCGGANSSDQPGYQALASLTHAPTNDKLNPIYQDLYSGVFRCNTVLDNVPNETLAQKVARAEAKCLRGYYYFELVTMFGNVPLVTQVLESGTNPGPSTPTQIWAQVEKDFSEAAEDLPVKSALVGVDAFRVSQETANAFLGRALLFQNKYDEAIVAFEAALSTGNLSLGGDFSQVLRKGTEFGSESILEVSFITTEGHTWGNGTFQWGNGRKQENNIHWQLCGPRGDGYFEPGNSGLVSGWGFAYPREEMYQVFTDANDLVRRSASMLSEDELIAYGGDYRKDGELPYGSDGYVRLKYGTWMDETDVTTQPELNYGTNVRIYRVGALYLDLAEAYSQTSDDGNAAKYINLVRKRVSLDDVSSTGTALYDDILSERQRELMFEGYRFQDLVRQNLASTVLAYKNYLPKHALLPIPADELAVNPNMKQNPGW